MLKKCAPGHVITPKTHHYWIEYNGKFYKTFPKGEHGKGKRAEIERGHIKQMVKHLEIDEECAKIELPEAY